MTDTHYAVHSIESAPEQSRPALLGLKQRFGLVPNLAATMAESPTLVNNFVAALMGFSGGTFTPGERQVLLLTNAVTNQSAWAVAFHSTAALGEGVTADAVAAIRDGRLPAEPKLAALSRFTRSLIESRGHVRGKALDAFLAAGFTRAQVLEVIAGLAVSVMANYAGNVAPPPLEAPFQAQVWAAK
ncbi:MAG: carboxymuconolactone decarboxylase family protein [Myxococcaceae bacterium]|nr:carboxymuconolactone decarboxylase family protein [Myxococcaceae bacterium]